MTAIGIIACIAGLVWGTYFCVRGSLVGGCLLYLATACCFAWFQKPKLREGAFSTLLWIRLLQDDGGDPPSETAWRVDGLPGSP